MSDNHVIRGLFVADRRDWEKRKPAKWACVICYKQSTRKRRIGGRLVVICANCEKTQKGEILSTLFEIIKPAATPKGIRFTVFGTPKPQGSTRAFIPKGWKRAIITTDNTNLKPWRQQISATAQSLNVPVFHDKAPIRIVLDFFFARPKTAKNRKGMIVKPDLDKLQRAIFDGITGILIRDDSQIVDVQARKLYGDPERVEIEIQEAAHA